MEEKLIFQVEIEGNEELLRKMGEIRKETTELREDTRNYQKALKDGKPLNDAEVEQFERKISQIKNNQKELNELTKRVQASSRSNKQHEGSLKRISEQLSAKKILYRSLTKEQRENTQQGKNLLKNIQQLDQEYKDINLKMGNTNVLVGDYAQQIRGLRPELTMMRKRLQEMKLAGEDGTQEFINLRNEASRLQDQIDKTNNEIKIFADDALVINSVTDVVKLGTSAFGAYQSVVALTGVENEKLMEMMVKLQAVQTLSNSVQQVSNLLQKDSRLILLANTGILKTKTIIQNLYTAAVMGSVKAMALLTGGITLIIGLVATLVMNWEKVVGWFRKSTEESDNLTDSTDNLSASNDRLTLSYSDSVKVLEHQIRLMRAMGVSMNEIEEKQRELILLKIRENEEQLKSIEAAFRWEEEINGVLVTYEMWQDAIKETEQLNRSLNEELEIFDATRERRIREREERIRNEKLKTFEQEQQLAEKRRVEEQKEIEDMLNRSELAEAQLLVLKSKTLENELHLLQVRKQQTLDNEKLTNAERLLIEEQFRQEMLEIRRRYKEEEDALEPSEEEVIEEQDVELEQLRKFYESVVKTREDHLNMMYDTLKTALDKEVITYDEYVNAIKRLDQEVLQNKLQNYSQIAGLIVDAAELMGVNFKLLKGLAISEGLINTYSAALNAFKSVPYPLNFIAAGSVVTKGLAQVNNIRKQKAPTMAEGGIIEGKSHSQGGVPLIDGNTGRLVAEVEGGEYFAVVNKKDTKTLNMLSNHNSQHGKPFTKTNYAADGGILDLDVSPRQDFSRFSIEDVIRITTEQITSIPVTLLINDVTGLQRKVQMLEQRGDLG